MSYESLTKSNVHQLSGHLKRKKLLNTLKAVNFSWFLFSIMKKELARRINLTLEFCIHLMPYPTELISQLDITA
jgi:hypothetical protein